MKAKERVVLGVLGALLGSILGSVCIVLENQVSSTFSLIGGVAMAAFTLQGYIQLAGRLSKKGVAVSLALMAVMCALANQINCTIEILETVEAVQGMDFLEVLGCFEELPEVQEIRSWYDSQLLLLYLFTLGGSFLILVRSCWKPRAEARRRAVLDEVLLGGEPEAEEEKPELQGTFYTFQKVWMKPLRISAGGFVMVLMVLLVALLTLTLMLEERFQADLEAGMIAGCALSCIPLLWITLTITRQCNAFPILFVRTGTRLWRVNLMKFCRVGDWEILPPARQAVIRDDVLWELENILEGDFSVCRSGAVTELRDIRAEKEDRWSWTVSYEQEEGTRKKLRIPKGYPDFTPAMGMERARGPVPCRWLPGLAALALTVVFLSGSVGFARWHALQSGEAAPEPLSGPGQAEAALPDVPVRVPETYTEFVISEIRFRVDGEFQYSRRRFLDGKTGTSYRVYTQYGVDEADAWDTLTSRTDDPLYDRFQAVYSGEDLLALLGETSRYNIVSVYRTDGTICHTAAALSDTGALFTLEAEHTQADQSPEEVLANLMYTLQTIRFEGPEVTEENYQTKIHLSKIRNCAYMAAAYIKTDHFGHEAFVDVYVPYSDTPIYAADGRAIRTEAHGLRVYASILPGENAKEVVEARQEVLASTGQVYEDGVDDQSYREDLDAACMLTVYEENGRRRNAVLYAESMWEGYYLLREITGLPEEIDGEYLPLLKELEEIFGLTMPVLEQLGE